MIQVVALAAGAGIARRWIARAEDVQPCFRIERARNPHLSAAVARRVEAWPGIQARVALFHRDRIELPLQLPGLRIVRLQESRHVEVVAGADQHVVVDDDRRPGREVLLGERRELDVPALLASLRIERHQIVVGRLEEQVVVPDSDAAAPDVRAAARLPEVVPQFVAVTCVDGPRVIRRRHVEDPVDFENGALDARRAPSAAELAGAFTADDRRRRTAPASSAKAGEPSSTRSGRRRRAGQPRHPVERQILHRGLVDQRQGAVAAARVIAGIREPVILERLVDLGRIQTALPLPRENCGRDEKRGRQQQFLDDGHLMLAR